jgi:hypothetical protein
MTARELVQGGFDLNLDSQYACFACGDIVWEGDAVAREEWRQQLVKEGSLSADEAVRRQPPYDYAIAEAPDGIFFTLCTPCLFGTFDPSGVGDAFGIETERLITARLREVFEALREDRRPRR